MLKVYFQQVIQWDDRWVNSLGTGTVWGRVTFCAILI